MIPNRLYAFDKLIFSLVYLKCYILVFIKPWDLNTFSVTKWVRNNTVCCLSYIIIRNTIKIKVEGVIDYSESIRHTTKDNSILVIHSRLKYKDQNILLDLLTNNIDKTMVTEKIINWKTYIFVGIICPIEKCDVDRKCKYDVRNN